MKLRYLIEKDYLVLFDHEILGKRMPEILQSKRNIFPVVDGNKLLKGVIYVEDILRNSLTKEVAVNLSDLLQLSPYAVRPETNVKAVLEIMERENVWVLPVLDNNDRYLGFVSKTAIFNKYRALLSRQADYME